MNWPTLDESVSLCICLLTVAYNREMQHHIKKINYWVFVVYVCVWGGISDQVRAQHLTVGRPIGLQF